MLTRTDLAADRARRLENAASLLVTVLVAFGWVFMVALFAAGVLGYVFGFWPGVGL